MRFFLLGPEIENEIDSHPPGLIPFEIPPRRRDMRPYRYKGWITVALALFVVIGLIGCDNSSYERGRSEGRSSGYENGREAGAASGYVAGYRDGLSGAPPAEAGFRFADGFDTHSSPPILLLVLLVADLTAMLIVLLVLVVDFSARYVIAKMLVVLLGALVWLCFLNELTVSSILPLLHAAAARTDLDVEIVCFGAGCLVAAILDVSRARRSRISHWVEALCVFVWTIILMSFVLLVVNLDVLLRFIGEAEVFNTICGGIFAGGVSYTAIRLLAGRSARGGQNESIA